MRNYLHSLLIAASALLFDFAHGQPLTVSADSAGGGLDSVQWLL